MIGETQLSLSHCSVFLNDVIKWLNSSKGGEFLDCTFGGGGHSEALLRANEKNFVYAIDRDPSAKQRAQKLSLTHSNFRFYQVNFSEVGCLHMPPLDGIVMDLGVSSFQLDDENRGFSFKYHTPLDMRMDNGRGITAVDFLYRASERELITAIRDYGEEEYWKKIISTILDNRKNPDMKYADSFAKIVSDCIPKKKGQKIHPATKTFQGIRIFINDELGSLEAALPILFDKLATGGRLAVISFHSLEDKIVKRFFNQMAGKAIDKFDSQPQQDRVSYANILTKKPITSDETEVDHNPRSRSAKLRILEKKHSIRD